MPKIPGISMLVIFAIITKGSASGFGFIVYLQLTKMNIIYISVYVAFDIIDFNLYRVNY